ncbi:MAG: hypothetical protein Q8L77_08245 [Nitrospirota bacterium]|nr:hypothetical protein [Nitrospirota bacterium]
MPKTPPLGTYISFKDVTGNSCTIDQLKSFLSRHKRSEVLFLCALLNTVLETWSGTVRKDVHEKLLEMAFLPEHASRLKGIISSSSHPQVVFHRAQILFVAKQAVLCCQDDETVLDRFRHPYWGGLGLAFLMANDLLHFDFTYRDRTTSQQDLIRMTHSIPVLESGTTSLDNRIGRAWLMLKKFGPSPSSGSYFNIEEAFLAAAGLSTDEYLAFCAAMISHYLALNFEQIAKMENNIGLTKEWFTRAHVNPKSVNCFLEDVSATPTYLAKKFLSRNWGPLDMTWFRDKPVCRLKGDIFVALDTRYLSEKLDSGIFWHVHSSLPSHKDKERLHNYWGITFENYMNWILEQACRNSPNRFYPSPKYKNGDEVCDAIIICGSTAIFLEYKGSTFTAQSKYKGDLTELAAEIEDNLIGTETKRKGVRQLTQAILRVFDKQTPASVADVDLSRINTIFPVLVTRDDIGGSWGISHYLQMKADGFFNRRKVRPKTVTPIFCLSSEGMEGISAYLQDKPISDLLHAWYSNDPGRYWSFQTIENSVISSHGFKKNTDLESAFKTVFENAIQVIFPGGTPASPG